MLEKTLFFSKFSPEKADATGSCKVCFKLVPPEFGRTGPPIVTKIMDIVGIRDCGVTVTVKNSSSIYVFSTLKQNNRSKLRNKNNSLWKYILAPHTKE